ncbi:dipeptidase [Limnoglobus roseus]|uniref:Membrane dipeptidase n=1 Tax=Limnoglobus roseus TaxID=2598579 RepID=A0A5C1ALH3_9BACT|nr:dipeptidase [Limnoglobus roseus]QEL20081.1 membrane dipeptidase [Limnoglobus roseus]
MPLRALAVLFFALPAFAADPPSRKPVVVTDAALKLHAEALVIDGHNDLPWELRRKDGGASFREIDLLRPQKNLHTDIPRLKKGGIGAQFWSAYVPVDTAKKGVAVKTTLEQIDTIHRMVKEYPNDFEMAYGTADIERIRKNGKIASLIGIEGGHSIDNSLGSLRALYRLGVRYMTLTHSESLDWADSATDAPKCGGLSPFGEQVIAEMNAIGMLVDLSHVSPECMKATLKVTKAPVIFSHSSARSVADHPRNVPDDVLKLVKANNGVVMVNFYSGFVVPEGARAMRKMFEVGRELKKKFPDDDAKYREAMLAWQKDNAYPNGTVHTVVDHIEHIIKVAGIDHVGLGSDFDGITKLPDQLEDVSTYPVITQEMLNRGYRPEEIKKMLGGNLMRVFRDAEAVAGKK